MDLSFDIWTVLLANGVIQGTVLSLVLALRRKRKAHNGFLSLLLLVFSLCLFDYLLIHSNLYRQIAHLTMVSQPLLFLIGPLYYFYIKSLSEFEYKYHSAHLLHLLPVLLPLIYFLPFYSMSFDEKVLAFDKKQGAEYLKLTAPVLIGMVIHTTQILVYVGLSLKIIKAGKHANEAGRFRLIWLRRFSTYFGLFWVIVLLSITTLPLTGRLTSGSDYIIMLSGAVSIYILAFTALSRSQYWEQHFEIISNQKKYAKSAISEDQITEFSTKLTEHMESEKPFLNPDLRLADLAKSLSISTNALSQVLNLGLGKTFSDFINEYRFESFKRKLMSSDLSHLTIYGIAQEAGFNNKYTYTQVFRKHTGMTPSQYLKTKSQISKGV